MEKEEIKENITNLNMNTKIPKNKKSDKPKKETINIGTNKTRNINILNPNIINFQGIQDNNLFLNK